VETVGKVNAASPESIRLDGETLPKAEMWSARRGIGPESTVLDRLRLELPYWSGNFDFGLNYQQGTTDSLALATGLGLRRDRGPWHTRFDAGYRRGTQKQRGEDEELLASELLGRLRQEYDITKRFFAFGSFEAEHDGIEELAVRLVPKAGVGYKFFEGEWGYVAGDIGPDYVYERFFGGDVNKYPALGLGAEHLWKLPYGMRWTSRIDYTPSLTDFPDDYLLRGETGLLFPITETLGFKVSLIDVYDPTPAEDADYNNLSSLVGLSLGF
jgi:putative salt-induced outer membrane protein YdiY